ncbi:cryptochrome/photolyase family protein [Geomicrobium sediminis]|uniref:Deoxyribodipyrimidine photo-lyase n=1 Tax=Geomicrobium sediminis TaxID=1347788 RepID=A0ABS2P8I5_9BACL|nr:deoxyribodipyrimidine photo-lyase [Geomicrobium sediminis]MBM7631622.1 deoxyribodipyrimidine photo-lyase [Geomicrobium sediminis]
MGTQIVWFRRDLRIHDNKALYSALEHLKEDDKLLLLYHIHPDLTDAFTKRHDYYYEALYDHVQKIEQQGGSLHFITGSVEEAFQSLFSIVDDCTAIHVNVDDTPFARERDQFVQQLAEKQNIRYYNYTDAHLHGAQEIVKKDHSHYQVFTPYYKQWINRTKERPCHIDLSQLRDVIQKRTDDFTEGQKQFGTLMQRKTGIWKKMAGSDRAFEQLQAFITKGLITNYNSDRDRPDFDGTSRLSAYLRTGAISPRTVYAAVQKYIDESSNDEGANTFIQELAWRDFYNMIYYRYPTSKDEEIISKYQQLQWSYDEERYHHWQNGTTGFPIVDAAMRQLNEIGWMHNRLRMIVASFLAKDLQLDWRLGERYFQDHLIDYDPASNIGGWQWAASTGTDAVPYFRIFNPTRQSERYDPDGTFITSYLPELKEVPLAFIHEPSKMSESEQEDAHCIIGSDYPKPIVSHQEMRQKTLERFKEIQ